MSKGIEFRIDLKNVLEVLSEYFFDDIYFLRENCGIIKIICNDKEEEVDFSSEFIIPISSTKIKNTQ